MKLGKVNKARQVKGLSGKDFSKVDQIISYQTFLASDGTKCAPTSGVVSKKSKSDEPLCLVSNYPDDRPVHENDGPDIPTYRDLTISRLRGDVASLRQYQKTLLWKLARCLEVIADQELFLENGLRLGQWETYDELMRRKVRLRGTRALIVDLNAEGELEAKKEKALKEKMIL